MIQNATGIVKDHYDLGELLGVEELHGGYCNRSFAVTVKKNGRSFKYLLRGYNPAAAEKEIKFEHALISHLKKNGLPIVAGVIPAISGGTYVKADSTIEGQLTTGFWAVFEFLEGDDRYTWIDTDLAAEEMISAAEVLARLHLAGQNFRKPPGTDRVQPKIMEFLPTFRHVYEEFTPKAGQTRFDQCFLKYRDDIIKTIDCQFIPEPTLNRMPQLPIHGDYHQGNLKYQDSRVIGVFDFDWSKIDFRLFDLALPLVYFCAYWEGPAAGSLNPDKYKLFLRTYNQSCAAGAAPGVLTEPEKDCLPTMLAAANLFVLHWIIVDFYTAENPDDGEYLTYLNHGLQLMDWIGAQKGRIGDITHQTCT